jgi:dTDP-4-dehydrorhamnose reductase
VKLKKKILLSGGNGHLGKCLTSVDQDKYIFSTPNSYEMDVRFEYDVFDAITKYLPDYFIHCAAVTRPMVQHEENPKDSIETNIVGTANVVKACICNNVKLIYISTDYVYPGTRGNYRETDALLPKNKYAWSKLGGECAVKMYENSLILRIAMVNHPFPHSGAIHDSWKSPIYDHDAAKIVLKLLDETGTINIGGNRKSIFEFASESRDVYKIGRKDICEYVARDSSLNVDKMRAILAFQDNN